MSDLVSAFSVLPRCFTMCHSTLLEEAEVEAALAPAGLASAPKWKPPVGAAIPKLYVFPPAAMAPPNTCAGAKELLLDDAAWDVNAGAPTPQWWWLWCTCAPQPAATGPEQSTTVRCSTLGERSTAQSTSRHSS